MNIGNVLSLFDGLSGAQLALKRAGIDYDGYYASEIDEYAVAVTQNNFPNTVQLGDVTKIKKENLPPIGLLIGGSPCQDLSIAKKGREGLKGSRSGLFWEYVRLLEELKPKWFLLENVASMPKQAKQVITETLCVEPVMINSALVSAQNRKRLYWTNIPNVEQPEDKGILLKDILEPFSEMDERMIVNGKSFSLTASYNGTVEWNSVQRKQRTMVKQEAIDEKPIKAGDVSEKSVEPAEEIENKDKSGCIQATYWKENLKSMQKRKKDGLYVTQSKPVKVGEFNKGSQGDRVYSDEGKSVSLSANGGGRGAKTGLYAVAQRGRYTDEEGKRKDIKGAKTQQRLETSFGEKANTITNVQKDSMVLDATHREYIIRKLTPRECERLQTVPDDYTLVPHPKYKNRMMSNTQRYKMLGNGFTVDVIAHILSFIKPETQNKERELTNVGQASIFKEVSV